VQLNNDSYLIGVGVYPKKLENILKTFNFSQKILKLDFTHQIIYILNTI